MNDMSMTQEMAGLSGGDWKQLTFLLLCLAASTWQTEIRLHGGQSANEGRLEMLEDGEWMAGCYGHVYYLLPPLPNTVCRQLNYSLGGQLYNFTAAYPTISRVNDTSSTLFSCYGNETSLSQCQTINVDCSANDVVGLTCDTGETPVPSTRLVESRGEKDGILEVFIFGSWHTVCANVLDARGADIACKSLFGQQYEGEFLANQDGTTYNNRSGPIARLVHCHGNESSVENCLYYSSYYGCTHTQDITIKCTEVSVRLDNSSIAGSGVLNVWSDDHWSQVCAEGWTANNTAVTCSQLGHPAGKADGSSGTVTGVGDPNITFGCLGDETSLSQCMTSELQNCISSVVIHCAPKFRLVDGLSAHEGRLEEFFNGTWYGACDITEDGLQNTVTADDVCRQLGYLRGGRGYSYWASYGASNVSQTLPYLLHRGYYCQTLPETSSCISHLGVACDTGETPHSTTRLLDAEGEGRWQQGRLQVFYMGTWNTLCSRSWISRYSRAAITQISKVACRAMFGEGYSGTFIPNTNVSDSDVNSTSVTGPILQHKMYCGGHEEDLTQCSIYSIYWRNRSEHNCTHDEDVIIKCETDEVRLAKGDKDGTGTLDVWTGDQWSAMCGDDWTLNNTQVVCKHLGYPGAVNESMMAVNVSGSPQYNASFQCLGNEKSLSECPTAQVESCNSSVFISCLGKVRLVDGGMPNAGRLEVFRGRRWYRARVFSYRRRHAMGQVVCRQLGFPTSEVLFHYKTVFGEGSLPPYNFEFSCTGDEAYLSRCEEIPSPFASLRDLDMAIGCGTDKEVRPNIRLVGGSTSNGTSREGVLQIYSHGFWGTVLSYDDWTEQNTRVACTHLLGPGSRGEKLSTTTFPAVPGLVLIQKVDCRGTESTLLDCSYWGLGKPSPASYPIGDHWADVALRCFPPVTDIDPCEVMEALAACDGSSQLCDVIDGQAVCRSKPTEGSGSTSLLAVYISVPAAVVVVLALVLWWHCSRRRHTKRSNASGSNNFDDNSKLTSGMNTNGKNKNGEIPTTLGLTTYPPVDNPTFEGNGSVRL